MSEIICLVPHTWCCNFTLQTELGSLLKFCAFYTMMSLMGEIPLFYISSFVCLSEFGQGPSCETLGTCPVSVLSVLECTCWVFPLVKKIWPTINMATERSFFSWLGLFFVTSFYLAFKWLQIVTPQCSLTKHPQSVVDVWKRASIASSTVRHGPGFHTLCNLS